MVDVSDSRGFVTQKITALLRQHGGLTRTELASLAGLPKSTISECARAMLGQQLLREQDTPDVVGARGRPAQTLHLTAGDAPLVVVVLTHGQELAQGDVQIAITADAGAISWSATAPSGGSPLVAAAELARHGLNQTGLRSADVSRLVLVVPLPLTRRVGVPDSHPDLRVIDVQAHVLGATPHLTLSATLEIPALLANDADMAALGEYRHGEGRGHPDLIFIKALHGLGMGLINQDTLVEPTARPTGELIYLRQPDDGTCFCRTPGCWFAEATPVPRGLAAIVHQSIPAVCTQADLDQACRASDVQVQSALYAVGMHIGAAIEQFCTLAGQPLIIMERELGAAFQPLSHGMTSILRAAAPALNLPAPQIKTGTLGPMAEVFGAIDHTRRANWV